MIRINLLNHEKLASNVSSFPNQVCVLPLYDKFLVQVTPNTNLYLSRCGTLIFVNNLGEITYINHDKYSSMNSSELYFVDGEWLILLRTNDLKDWTFCRIEENGELTDIGKKDLKKQQEWKVKDYKTSNLALWRDKAIALGTGLPKKMSNYYISQVFGELSLTPNQIVIGENNGNFPLEYKILDFGDIVFDCAIAKDGLTACFLTKKNFHKQGGSKLSEIILLDL